MSSTRFGALASPRVAAAARAARSFAASAASPRVVPPALRRLIRRDAVIVAQHKPHSFLSPTTHPSRGARFARDLLTEGNYRGGGAGWRRDGDARDVPGLECAGRLDAESTGLLLWADDPALVQHIIGQATPVEKEYLVRVAGHEHWSESQLAGAAELLREGISLEGRPLKRARVRWLNEAQLQVVLVEGRHRQIRRMCAVVGLEVAAIKRVRIGDLRLASLPVGCWSALSAANAASLILSTSARPAPPERAPPPPPRRRGTRSTPAARAEREAERARGSAGAAEPGLLFANARR